jgi:hypothetical protein
MHAAAAYLESHLASDALRGLRATLTR